MKTPSVEPVDAIQEAKNHVLVSQRKLELVTERTELETRMADEQKAFDERLAEITARINEIKAEGEKLDAGDLSSLENRPVHTGKRGRPAGSTNGTGAKKGRPAGSKNKTHEDGVRAKNETPLRELILDILKRNKSGLQLKDIVIKSREAGYQSNTKGDFSNIVYQALYKLIKTDKLIAKENETKKYRIAA